MSETTSTSAMRKGLDQFVSPDKKFETNKRSGKQLIVIAWIIEVIVVFAGLFFALYNIALALENKVANLSLWLNTLSGALPFIIIAIVELTKIPLAMGFYRATSKVWKTTFGVALLLLILVTFETMFGGLERTFTLTTEELRESEIKTTSLKANLETLQVRKDEYSKLTNIVITEGYNKEIDSQSDNKNKELLEIDNAEKNELESINNQLRNYDDIIYSQSVSDIDQRIDEITNTANSNFEQNVKQKTQITLEQTSRIDDQIQKFEDSREEELKNATGIFGGNTKGAVQSRYRKLIDEANLQKNNFEQDLRNFITVEEEKRDNILNSEELILLNEERRKSIENENGKYKDVIESLNAEKNSITKKFQDQRNEIEEKYKRNLEIVDERRDLKLDDLKNKESQIIQIDNEIAKEEDAINEENKIQREVKQVNQVYRFAKLIFDKDDIVEVTAGQVKLVSVIWFGSIAFITATMGVLLALAGYVLQDPEAFAKREKQTQQKKGLGLFANIKNFFRRSTVVIWNRMRRPKIKIQYVDKDVERIVEKEVIKEVEVPVEKEVVKWKTRVVQVPLYSTQPGMVDLDPEILSKTSMENSNLTPKKKDDKDDE
tara:strand:+ start:3979 stop:5790 length:1812 start_codon:yes stop_codon:yes gene_type:complete